MADERPVSSNCSLNISLSLKSLNSMSNLIGISSFKYQLICYYQKLCEADFQPHLDPKMNAWFVESQRLGFHSELVRNCIYAISTMHLDNLDFYDSFNCPSSVQSARASTFLNAHHAIFEPHQVRGFFGSKKLYRQTVQYFIDSVRKTMDIVNDIASGNGPHSVTQAVEILISSLIIFNLLLHHQTMYLPLISNDQSQPSLLSVCVGMKHMQSIILPYLEESCFGILFKQDTNMQNSNLCNKIALIENLSDCRLELEERGDILPHESLIYIDTTRKLETILYKLIILDDHRIIWGWISELDDEFYRLANEKKEYFACKLLFYYCSLRVNVAGRTSYQGNTWTDYCHWFKNYNLAHFGLWRDSKDYSLYQLVLLYKYELKDLSSFLATNEMSF